ncbi:Ppx/GppA phosphatase family protein [Rosettibacter firmus]|uniref:Ppx/GppA phosphatase family protein n=1 Tax=Rosettibacter firmus TaxID=3111522 RepID=UPI00336C1DA5
MIIASIDIGSNTILLLIARINLEKAKLETIQNYYRAPRISQGLLENGNISSEKINKLLNVLEEYKSIIEQYNCSKVFIVATNAFRIANNAKEILDLIKIKYNWTINIIDGEEEAKLSYLGATYEYSSKEKVVIDIGGGSTEIIYGQNDEIRFKKSFPIGVVSLTEKFIKNEIPTETEIIKLTNELNEVFKILDNIPKKIFTIAVAGTPTTLSCIKQNIKNYNEQLVDNSILTYNDVTNIADTLASMSGMQIKEKYGQVVEGREDVLFTGTIILKTIMEKLELEKITVSNKGLRYGVIVDYMKNLLQ